MEYLTFLNLLKSRLDAFRDFRDVQARIEHSLQTADRGYMASCEAEAARLDAVMSANKTELQPFIAHWSKLKKEDKDEYLKGEIGCILDSMDKIASEINGIHEKIFGSSSLPPSNASKIKERGLSSIISLYR